MWVELLFFFVCFLLFDTANLSRSEIIMLCVVVVCVMAKVGTVVIISIILPICISLSPFLYLRGRRCGMSGYFSIVVVMIKWWFGVCKK